MAPVNSVVQQTAAYEAWLGGLVPLWQDDLKLKHETMASEPGAFLRATFYRWAQRFPRLCPAEAAAPEILAVGDLHVENFGTWRDGEGRLVWGVNDFDEVATIPYTNDLIRLATSARLALKAGRINLTTTEACAAILSGYIDGMARGGRPFVLAESDRWLRLIAASRLRDPVTFWAHLGKSPALNVPLRRPLRQGLVRALPTGMHTFELLRRRAGLGSLGRERVVALGQWNGASIAREVKASAPSAWNWALARGPQVGAAENLLRHGVHCPDPYYTARPDSVVRRLAPDCSRVVLSDMPGIRDDNRLLRAMGWETANLHLANPGVEKHVEKDLAGRADTWLEDATRRMARAVMRDWKEWRTEYRKRPEVRDQLARAHGALSPPPEATP